SIVCSCAAMRDAGDASVRDFRARKVRTAASAPGFASHCLRQAGSRSSSVSGDGRSEATRSRRTIAYSNVFSAATCRMLTCRSPLRDAGPVSCRADATISNTPHRTGTTAVVATIANCSSVALRRSAMRVARRRVHVDRETQHRYVRDERRHSEAYEGKWHAGERNHRDVAGDRHRELAHGQHDPRHADPAQEGLFVAADTRSRANEAGLAARGAGMTSNDPMKPYHATQRKSPRGSPAELADKRRERVIALDLHGNAGACAAGSESAPWNRAEPETGRRRR